MIYNSSFWGICYHCNKTLNDEHSYCDCCNKLYCEECIEDETIFLSSDVEGDYCVECYRINI